MMKHPKGDRFEAAWKTRDIAESLPFEKARRLAWVAVKAMHRELLDDPEVSLSEKQHEVLNKALRACSHLLTGDLRPIVKQVLRSSRDALRAPYRHLERQRSMSPGEKKILATFVALGLFMDRSVAVIRSPLSFAYHFDCTVEVHELAQGLIGVEAPSDAQVQEMLEEALF